MQLARQYAGKLAIVGIAGRDDAGPMSDFARQYQLPFPSGADFDLSVWRRLGVRGQPAWVFVNPNGTGHRFYRPADATVRAQLDALVAKNVTASSSQQP